jgi:uncharacterized protein affecting Mg2+/Co2+ transport
MPKPFCAFRPRDSFGALSTRDTEGVPGWYVMKGKTVGNSRASSPCRFSLLVPRSLTIDDSRFTIQLLARHWFCVSLNTRNARKKSCQRQAASRECWLPVHPGPIPKPFCAFRPRDSFGALSARNTEGVPGWYVMKGKTVGNSRASSPCRFSLLVSRSLSIDDSRFTIQLLARHWFCVSLNTRKTRKKSYQRQAASRECWRPVHPGPIPKPFCAFRPRDSFGALSA